MFLASAVLAAAVLGSGAVAADGRGHHGVGHHGGRHHGDWSGRFYHGGYPGWHTVFLVGGPGAGGPGRWGYSHGARYGYGYDYDYPAGAYPRYRVVETQAVMPQEFITKHETAPPAATSDLWFYCTDPAGYHPYVRHCNTIWIEVEPLSANDTSLAPRTAR